MILSLNRVGHAALLSWRYQVKQRAVCRVALNRVPWIDATDSDCTIGYDQFGASGFEQRTAFRRKSESQYPEQCLLDNLFWIRTLDKIEG